MKKIIEKYVGQSIHIIGYNAENGEELQDFANVMKYPKLVCLKNEEENAILLEVLDDCFGIYFDQKIIHIPYFSILGGYEIPKMPNIFEGCFEKANNILEVYNNQEFSLKLVLKYFDVDPSLNDIEKKYFSDYMDY